MKFIFSFLVLGMCFNAVADEHGYGIEGVACNEFVCAVEVANDEDFFVVVLDREFVDSALEENGENDLRELDVVIEKDALKKATKKQLAALRDLFTRDLEVFMIDSKNVEITKLQRD